MRSAGARNLWDTEESWVDSRRPLRLVDDLDSEAVDAAERRVRELRPAERGAERRPPAVQRAAHADRRTIQITGQAAAPRRRGSPTAARVGARPDRVALWAFFLAVFLIFMAVVTAGAGS